MRKQIGSVGMRCVIAKSSNFRELDPSLRLVKFSENSFCSIALQGSFLIHAPNSRILNYSLGLPLRGVETSEAVSSSTSNTRVSHTPAKR